jgi:autotransporter-associated beta strand protein
MKYLLLLSLALTAGFAHAVSIDAIYFGQTHVHKPDNPYFGTVGGRDVFIKVHVTDPATPSSPSVFATLNLAGQFRTVPLTGPATLPASISDGLGVVNHTTSRAISFTGVIPADWVKTGLQVTVNAGSVMSTVTNMKVTAPTKVIMTMTDVQYFSDTNSDYPAGTFAELEAKWPVADLEVRRLGHVVFPELVIPPRTDVGTKAERIRSKAEYTVKTGLPFDGEQAAALAWNGALKRAAGRSGRWSLYYLNVYNAFAGGQAGGFAGVGAGNSVGILHHELGHALSLPHWGDNVAYPYKGDMHGIQAPNNYKETHAGPAWAFHLPTRAFIPPTVQPSSGAGVYKVDPMQGGGTGDQESPYLMNHFSDYSVNQMRNYMNGHVVVWNPALNSGNGSWAQWNQTAGDYTTAVSNNGVEYPTVRDTQVISIMASISGSDPDVTMVYPPIGPYTAGLIRLFDPTVAADRTAANSIFSPANGSDLCVRVVQGGVTKTYMLAASWLTTQDEYSSGSLVTEAINLPAADGTVTKIELLLTPNVEDVGLPANPQVLSIWAPLTPEPAAFESVPNAYSSSAVTMKAVKGEVAFGFTGTVEYLFDETTGNPGGTDSGWQTSRSYTDTGLQAGTQYSYTVSMRTVGGALTTTTSAAATATTLASPTVRNVTVNSTQQFSLVADLEGYRAVTGLGTFDAGTADKLVVVVSTEDKNNSGVGYVYDVRYNGKLMTEAIQEEAGSGNGAAAIFYLDNPGPRGTGTIEVSAELPNGGIGAAYALSGTMAGVAVTNSRAGTAANSVSLTTAGQNSVVIAVLENSGNPNSAGTPTANAPLTQGSSGSWGSAWGSHASGHQFVATPTAITPTFTTNTGSGYSINVAAAEFPAQPPLPNVWSQAAGGTQNWTTNTNWDDGVVPNPTSTTTMDFSSVELAADTNLVLGANRTARIWKFGDTSGTQNWTVNAGNTLTLAGSIPTIEVENNTTQFNNVVAGSAGLTKTGTGTLILSGTNTYSGVTRISAGTLQAATLANGGTGNNSSIGASSNAATNLILNGGTLRYTGAAVNTDRLFSLQASSSFDASGTGAVNFNNTGTMGFSGNTADKTLTLTGTNTDANTIAAIIGDNIVDITGATSLTKSGLGTWVLSGANTYSGATTISGGTLRLANTAAVQDSSGVTLLGTSSVLQLGTNTAFAGFPQLIHGYSSSSQGTIVSDRATGGAGIVHALGSGNFGNTTINFTAGSNVTSGTAGISFTSITMAGGSGGTLTLNPTTANLILTGNATGGSTGTTNIGNLALSGTSTGNVIQGIIENGTRTTQNVTKSGAGTWTLLSGANTYNGFTNVSAGTIVVTKLANGLSASSIGTSANDATNLRFGSGAVLSYTGTGDSTDRQITFSPNSNNTGFSLDASGSGPINFTNTAALVNTTTNQGRYFALSGSNSGNNTLAAQINNNGTSTDNTNLSKNGTGKWVLTNTTSAFTGSMLINNGTLGITTLTNSGSPSPIGAGTTIGLGRGNDSGTLLYTGAGHTTNRPIRIGSPNSVPGTGGGSIINDGTGPLLFTNAIFNTPVTGLTGSQNRTVTLGGSYTATANEIQGVIANNTASTGLVGLQKIGPCTWTLSNNNTYTGPTTISAGTLALGISNALAATPITLGAATLNAATFTDTVGTLDITAAANIQLGTGGALAFADSSAIDWTGGTLAITGTFVSGASLRFGTTSSALTPAQLAQISKPGGGAVILNTSGFLIDLPTSGYALWAATNASSTTMVQDQDKDGVSNALEYVLGGTALLNDLARFPNVTISDGHILYTFKRDQTSINASTALAIKVSSSLVTWPLSYDVGADTATSSSGVNVIKGAPPGFDTVTLSLPYTANTRYFIHLSVTITP